MQTIDRNEEYSAKELTAEEIRKLFAAQVKELLDIEVSQFISEFRAGKYESSDDCDIRTLLMMLPFTGYSEEYPYKQSCSR